jgi:hypothetical protein
MKNETNERIRGGDARHAADLQRGCCQMCAPGRGKSAGTGISVIATFRQAHIGLSHRSGSDSKQFALELDARYVGLIYDGHSPSKSQ